MWTMNFQMFKLDLEKAEEPKIKLPTSFGSSKKQESSRKTSISALLTMPKLLTVWITTNCGKFLEMGIPDHLTHLLRNLYAGQEATVRTGYGTMDWFKIGKGVCQGCILSPCLFNLYLECIMWNARLDDSQKLESRLLGEILVTQGGRWHHPNDRKQKETKELLDEGERGEWKSWLKTEHSKTKIMASGLIISWQIDGQTMETVTNFIFLG